MIKPFTIHWSRWIATLCVALAAFVMMERAFCFDGCGPEAALSYNIAEAADAGWAHQDGGAQHETQGHHCCAAHAPAMPASSSGGALRQAALTLPAPRHPSDPLSHEQDGPERPPRSAAIA